MSTQDVGSPQETVRKRRWMWPVLVISVALNLLIIGAIAGFIVRHRGPEGLFGGTSLISYVRSLPRDRRRQLRPLLREAHQTLKPLRRNLRQARKVVDDSLRRETFSRDEYVRAVDRQLQALAALRKAASRAHATIAEKLSGAERRDYLEWRDHRRFKRWRMRRFKRWRDRD